MIKKSCGVLKDKRGTLHLENSLSGDVERFAHKFYEYAVKNRIHDKIAKEIGKKKNRTYDYKKDMREMEKKS